MGLIMEMAEVVAQATARQNLKGRILTYGRVHPNFNVTYDFARSLLTQFGLRNAPMLEGPAGELLPNAEMFFEALGYDGVESLDVSDYEQPTYVWDLNRPTVPDGLIGRFDVAFNNGTLEHIFHAPNCLANVTKMLRTGGHVMHWAPCHNFFNHGFYAFSPCFFFDYYAKNKFSIKESIILRRDNELSPFRVWGMSPFNPYDLPASNMFDGKMDSGVYLHFFLAQKTPESTDCDVPLQGDYLRSTGATSLLHTPSMGAVERQLTAEIDALKYIIEKQQELIDQKDQVQTNLYRQILLLQGINPDASS